MLRVFNDTARYIDQGGGKRNGSFAIYLEPWHSDIFDFLELKKNHGNEMERARDLFYGLWIPDCFMKAVEKDENWYLMCPDEWQNFDTIIGEHFYVDNLRFSKLLKHGLLSLARNPLAIIKSKRSIRFHFDMWHGNGNLDKAIDLLDEQDREDFRKFTRKNVSFYRGNMFVCRSKKIINGYNNMKRQVINVNRSLTDDGLFQIFVDEKYSSDSANI